MTTLRRADADDGAASAREPPAVAAGSTRWNALDGLRAVAVYLVVAFVDECSFAVEEWPHRETGMFRRIAGERSDVSTVDMTTLACPHFPVCRPIVDGIQILTDADHLDEGWVQRIGPDLVRLAGLDR